MTLFITAASIVFGITPGAAQIVERPPVSGRHAVVTSDEPLASMAGMRMLHEGGNAFDAALVHRYRCRGARPANVVHRW